MCAIPAAKYAELDAATAPDVLGPITASTDLFAIIFCATVCAIDAPCSTGVSPTTRPTLSPSFGASVFDRVLHPGELLGADEAGPAGQRRETKPSLMRALAADGLARRCRRLSCTRTGSEDRRR